MTDLATNGITITSKQRRMLKRLGAAIDRVSDDDRSFFAAHPERNFRIRLQTKAERRELAIVSGSETACPPGHRRYTVVRQVAPECRIRFDAVIEGLNHVERFSEAMCRRIFEEAAWRCDQMKAIEDFARNAAKLQKGGGAT